MTRFKFLRARRTWLGWLAMGLLITTTACGGTRKEQAPSTSSTGPAQVAPVPASAQGDPQAGQAVFAGSCASCHGANAKGLPGLGKDLTTSEFVARLTDTELVKFIKVGRDTSDPANTTGVAMPPKGGNPALTDRDLYDVVAYLRKLQKEAAR